MIKLICFDFDGVLCDMKDVHFNAFNKALEGCGYKPISEKEHIEKFDGLSTLQKISSLGINQENNVQNIFSLKQKYTLEEIKKFKKNEILYQQIKALKDKGFSLSVNSNAISNTVKRSLKKLGIIELFDDIITNEKINNKKPHPEIYYRSFIKFKCLPNEVLIIEDSKNGRLSANRSGAYVYGVDSSKDVNAEKIVSFITSSCQDDASYWNGISDLNIVIPMAGNGSRFANAGYKLPKPLVNINGMPMIWHVINMINIRANYIFIVQKQHIEKYNIDIFLKAIMPQCKIVEVSEVTEGAACTVLLAKKYIDNNNKLIICNSDQILKWNSSNFVYDAIQKNADGSILTFISDESKYSYAKCDENNNVIEVKEKQVISNLATCGLYYYKHGNDFVKYTENMIKNNIRTNNEFYVAPIYNEYIADNKKIIAYPCEKMYGVGTPEDLMVYLNNNANH
jgi:HAD superfamily hydrolase (TIGR01509 family)